jgi:CASP C terminal
MLTTPLLATLVPVVNMLQEVQRDNLALYKKLRFMTAFSKGQQQQQPHSRQPRNNSGSSSGAAGGMLSDRDAATAAAEARYADLYERELDPFRAFAQSEAEVSVTTSTITTAVLLRL